MTRTAAAAKPQNKKPTHEYRTKSDSKHTRERKITLIDMAMDQIHATNGTVTVDSVLDAAEDEGHALHRFFEWDDSVAGRQWRRHQAHQMIMASKFVVTLHEAGSPPEIHGGGDHVLVRRLVSAFRGEGFRMRNEALADEGQRKILIERFTAELRGWCRRVVDIEELGALREMIAEHLR